VTQVTSAVSICEEHVSKPDREAVPLAVRWSAALLALASAGVHVLALATGDPPSPAQVLVLLGMALACLPCAVHLALLPRRRTWVQAAAVSAAMVVAHPLAAAAGGHAHHGAAPGGGVLGVAMVVVPALGLVLALVGLALGRRGADRSRRLSGPPHRGRIRVPVP
jgi:peptidoglycan/LPS O-acetylase OafA/YrhL